MHMEGCIARARKMGVGFRVRVSWTLEVGNIMAQNPLKQPKQHCSTYFWGSGNTILRSP